MNMYGDDCPQYGIFSLMGIAGIAKLFSVRAYRHHVPDDFPTATATASYHNAYSVAYRKFENAAQNGTRPKNLIAPFYFFESRRSLKCGIAGSINFRKCRIGARAS